MYTIVITTTLPNNEISEKRRNNLVNNFSKFNIPLIFNECLKICDIVVGHNISFDKRLIFVECFRHNITQYFTQFVNNQKIHKPEFCTMKNTAQYCKLERLSKTNQVYNKMPKLSELYLILFPNEPLPKDLHNSLIDVAITLRCYLKYVYNSDIIEVNDTLRQLF